MTIEHIDPLDDPRWPDLLERGSGSVFAHPAWLRLLQTQYGYPVTALAVSRDGELVAGVPLARVESRLTGRRLVSVPFSDSCPPVVCARAGDSAVADLCVALEAERLATRLSVEVRWPLTVHDGAEVLPRFLHHRLALHDDAEAFERGLRSQVRRNIKKARRCGVAVASATDRAALEIFYGLHLRTRRRQGVPTQPKSFILGLASLLEQGLGFVMTARHDGRAVAAAVFLASGDTVVYKYGASDERFLDLRPNNLLFLEAITRSAEDGRRWLDFGRTDFGHDGLRSFKLGWGAEERPLAYTYFGEDGRADPPGRATKLLATAIRRGPPWVGRGVGAALYRHIG